MSVAEIVDALARLFTTLAVTPQIVKAIKANEVKGVSSLFFIIVLMGVGLWVVYGFLKTDWPIIITNGISFILNGIMLYIYFKTIKWKL